MGNGNEMPSLRAFSEMNWMEIKIFCYTSYGRSGLQGQIRPGEFRFWTLVFPPAIGIGVICGGESCAKRRCVGLQKGQNAHPLFNYLKPRLSLLVAHCFLPKQFPSGIERIHCQRV